LPYSAHFDPGCADNRGFTLIEIVVALAILGTSLVMLLEIHFGAMDLFSKADETTTLRILTESTVNDAERDVLAGNTSGEGDFGRRFDGYTYRYEATQVDPQNTPGLFEVKVNVAGPADDRDMTFYMYDGQQGEEGDPGSKPGTTSKSKTRGSDSGEGDRGTSSDNRDPDKKPSGSRR
jgi:prepilin-type N-terminal cleavage/methylation domain-containing protein